MNIGVDAGALSITDERLQVGVYRVILNLLRELGKFDTKNTYRLYSFDPIDPEVLRTFDITFENRVIWPSRGWSTVRLPLELSLHPVDVFLGVSQMVPKHAGHAIGFIYDMGFHHRPESYPGSVQKLKKMTDDLIERSEKIITISKTVKDDIIKLYGFPEKNITVAYVGVDERFTPIGTTYSNPHPYFLFVGAMKPGKNIPAIIEAFAEFLTQSTSVFDLILVGGDYWKDPAIETTINATHLQDRVKVQGHVPDDMLAPYYRGAIAFVSPSHYEGFCIPAAEAMSCGCPVIGSTKGAMGEITGNAGILVDPTDNISLVRAMKEMAYNAKQRDKYAKNGIKNSKKFRWKTFAETVFAVMLNMADGT